ncbi:hypothetical protein MKW94_001935 [Papaver nudicaule]|uniref:Uncharacterized protein n=1 Tax=Papaver nudicaule TaxID=74823 RepID=A0AA41UWJ7_PAPNU|nr:hypothetical protein [Papaver nudicaule]
MLRCLYQELTKQLKIQSSPWFRDYWLRECFQDPQFDDHHFDEAVLDAFTTQDEEDVEEEEEIEKNYYKDLISFGVLKWRKSQGMGEKSPKYEKAPKFVKMQVNPRPIQKSIIFLYLIIFNESVTIRSIPFLVKMLLTGY